MAVAPSPVEPRRSFEKGSSTRCPSVAKPTLAASPIRLETAGITKSTTSRYRIRKPLALFEGEGYFYCEATLITGQEETANERVDKLIRNIENIVHLIPEQECKCFEIGIVGVSESSEISFDPMKHNTWGKTELRNCWEGYKKKEYDALIVLSIVTKKQVPETSLVDQKKYAEMLKDRLVMYYTIETNNSYIQIMDKTKEENKKTGYALYMAIKQKKKEQNKKRRRDEEDVSSDAPKATKPKTD